uniref:THAP domain-containing protein 1 n=1 Tax=Echeneis naucrates TaxID=173247 RepID=A0A665WU58_ECHNA
VPHFSCSAPNCSNSTSIGKQLFRFPKDPDRKKKWVVNCRRDFEPTPHSRLCQVGSHRRWHPAVCEAL